MNGRRNRIEGAVPVRFNSHAGLWFDKYLKEQADSTLEPYAEHIMQVAQIREPAAYRLFFERWKAELQKMGVHLQEAKVVARLAAGLGGASVIENGLTLHHTYGVPFIPGSSLKGTTRAYAAANLEGPWGVGKDDKGNKIYGDAFRTLFGGQALPSSKNDSEADKERKKARVGIAVFYDALPVPGAFHIHNEVMTVHHREYYQDGKQAPADWDSPTPIPFPSVSGRFLIAVHAPDAPEWAVSAMGILQMALEEYGVGGKTSSGFGRLSWRDSKKSASNKAAKSFVSTGPPPGYEQGMVKFWKTRGNDSYGFIISHKGDDVYVHVANLSKGLTGLEPRQKVYFRRGVGRGKKDEALDVKLA